MTPAAPPSEALPASGGALAGALTRAASPHARTLAARAFDAGLAVTRPDASTTPIALSATPIVIDDRELERRQAVAALIASAGARMARYALADDALRPQLLGALSPLERSFAADLPLHALATTRVDFFEDALGLKALELNATIPAMQGYSDAAASAYLDVLGASVGADARTVERWRARNGSNARALFDALLAGYRRVRPSASPAFIALLCRRNDAQRTELQVLARAFSSYGIDARLAHPDQLELTDDALLLAGRRVDLVYRHLFVRRLEDASMEGADVVRALLRDAPGARAVVLNPPASQVEVKTVFAWLSEAATHDALAHAAGLTADERDAIARAVPWTRALRPGPLVDDVAARPDELVLKRAWDYGGRAVLIGRERDTEAFAARLRTCWPADAADGHAPPLDDWPSIVARAAADPRGGGFVVQERVDAKTTPHVLCSADGATEADVYVDFSMYASVDLGAPVAWGGVCRTSTSSVVNIMGGGGLAPVLKASVAAEIALALARRDGVTTAERADAEVASLSG